jgi:hypothetical protein
MARLIGGSQPVQAFARAVFAPIGKAIAWLALIFFG